MINNVKLPFFTLLLLISFASVNAVLFTPALPMIAQFFLITEDKAQLTISWFLIGYALGQLIYGPLANRFGRKPALYMGICLQIFSSLICVAAGYLHLYWLLVVARFLLALGSGVGLKMTFTYVNECYEPKIASEKISYLMLAFAITPGLSIALGGVLNTFWGWMSCFYAGAFYGIILLLFVARLPETQKILDLNALKFKHLVKAYANQFKNFRLILGGLLMGMGTAFVYIFAALAPFIAMNLYGMKSEHYGFANLLPPLGLLIGSLISAQCAKRFALMGNIFAGIIIITLGVISMFLGMMTHLPVLAALFVPTIIIYFGMCFIFSNASSIAMSHVTDKAHGAAVMSFINMGFATLGVLSLGYFPIHTYLLPSVYLFICGAMALIAFLFYTGDVINPNRSE